jgi:3D (Asp-Asp-Asp) domain-containing protein
MRNRDYFFLFCLALAGLFLGACGTTSTMRTSRTSPLPKYETPLMKRDFQNVRTTAYTHTEADHRQFTNHNALGGRLQAATGAIRRAEYTPRAAPVSADDDQSDYRRASYNPSSIQPFSLESRRTTKVVKTKHGKKRVVVVTKPQIGSAAADWSRWPAGTVFRLLSTGQVYKIDDYGWALAGRNTIDLYMPSRSAMNSWGARAEGIEILRWGNPNESLRLLQAHQSYRHIRRMVLELQGQDAAAASLE